MNVELTKNHHVKMDALWPKYDEVVYEPEKIETNNRKKNSRNSTPDEPKKIIIDPNEALPNELRSTKDNESTAQEVPSSPQLTHLKIRKSKKIKQSLYSSSSMIRMITKVLHF